MWAVTPGGKRRRTRSVECWRKKKVRDSQKEEEFQRQEKGNSVLFAPEKKGGSSPRGRKREAQLKEAVAEGKKEKREASSPALGETGPRLIKGGGCACQGGAKEVKRT